MGRVILLSVSLGARSKLDSYFVYWVLSLVLMLS